MLSCADNTKFALKDPSKSQFFLVECKCDHRGTQIEEQYGNWCYIKETPCNLLNGALTYLHWQRCHEFGNKMYQELIKCPSISRE